MPSIKENGRTYEDKPEETTEQKERKKRILMTLDQGLQERRPFEKRIKKNLLLVSGQSPDVDIPDKVRYVSPLAYIFVEAKTAEEVRAMSEFAITPVEDAGDAWKVPFLEDVTEHVETKVGWKSKRIQMIRMKNIAGVSVARVGYRCIKGKRKIGKEYDEQGRMTGWKEIEVPVYDDLFIDLVSPLDFVIDPNATSINDAQWCGQFHAEHMDDFREAYGSDERFNGVFSVKPGDGDMVAMYEHFNKTLDEWVLYTFPYTKKPKKTASEMSADFQEIGSLALPDDHKMLPFFSYHNASRFADDQVGDPYITEDGEYTAQPYDVRDRETFWTDGVPAIIDELITLRTNFGRSANRALELAGQTIHLTANNYSLDEAIPWKSGMQAIGGLNKVQSYNLGAGINIGAYEFAFRDIFEQCVMAIGVDPRNLTDTKVKTLGEAEIQNETAARRLALGILFNEENGELQRGWLMVKDEQQYYSTKELVRLTGRETEKDLTGYSDIQYDGDGKDKKPVAGRRYRRIASSRKLMDSSKEDNLYIEESDFGINSFASRGEYIRTSDIDIRVVPKNRVDQSDAVTANRYDNFLQRAASLFQIVNSKPETTLDAEKLSDAVSRVLDGYMNIFGLDEKSEVEEPEKIKELEEVREKVNKSPMLVSPPQE